MRRRFGIARVVIALTALVAASVVVPGATPDTAHARCAGQGNPRNLTLVVNGTTYVTERGDSDTCNGNGVYQGSLRSNVSGRRAVLLFRRSPGDPYQQGASAGTSWVNWQMSEGEASGDASISIVLCSSDSRYTTCGIGSSYVTRPYGQFYTGIHATSWGF